MIVHDITADTISCLAVSFCIEFEHLPLKMHDSIHAIITIAMQEMTANTIYGLCKPDIVSNIMHVTAMILNTIIII